MPCDPIPQWEPEFGTVATPATYEPPIFLDRHTHKMVCGNLRWKEGVLQVLYLAPNGDFIWAKVPEALPGEPDQGNCETDDPDFSKWRWQYECPAEGETGDKS